MKIILGDSATYSLKGFGTVKFDLDYGDFFILPEVMYVLEQKNNLVFISSLEYKCMRVAFIKGKNYTWSQKYHMRVGFTLGSRVEGLYRVNGRHLLAIAHETNYKKELCH